METTFTLVRRTGSIEGYNNRGQCFAAAYNGGGKWNVGTSGYVSHDSRTGEVSTREQAIAWVVDMLLNAPV